MLKLYQLNLDHVSYWQKTINSESQSPVFMKSEIASYQLLLDKMGNPRSMPEDEGVYFMDLVSGRVISIKEEPDCIVIYPSGIKLPKESLVPDKKALEKATEILQTREEQYIAISEDILFNTYFCNQIAQEEAIEEIPLELVDAVINARREYAEDNNQGKGIKR